MSITPPVSPRKAVAMEEVRRILNTPEFLEIPSPARRVVRYKKLQNERNYPDLSLSLTCSIAGTNLSKVRRRMQNEADGTVPGKKGRHRALTQFERRELVTHIRNLAEQGNCPTYEDLRVHDNPTQEKTRNQGAETSFKRNYTHNPERGRAAKKQSSHFLSGEGNGRSSDHSTNVHQY